MNASVRTVGEEEAGKGLLRGFRILELGHFIAAPVATRVLADLGAEVIKIEAPEGDPVRQWGRERDGRSAWWSYHGRNKKSVVVNLKSPEGRELIGALAARCDAVVENFRPRHLARIGLSDDFLRKENSSLIIAHVSGFGQDGPRSGKAGFGVIGEAVGGLRYLTNHPPGETNLPPVRVGVSIGDSITGLYAALGVVAALLRRERLGKAQAEGRTLDVALTDAVLSMTEGVLPEYSAFGIVRQPTGSRLPTASPTNAYPTADGQWILLAANSDPLFARLCRVLGRPDIAEDPRFRSNRDRVENVEELDRIIADWTREHDGATLERILDEADIPASRIYAAPDIANDPQFRHRGMVREVDDPVHGKLLHPGIVPLVVEEPPANIRPGPEIGEDTEAVLRDLLGLTEHDIADLRDKGAIK